MTYYEDDGNGEIRTINSGDQLGPYRIIARKGGGAHGTVYQVEHVILGKRFALKQLQASVDQGGNIEQRFLREARLLAMLEHPNIVQIVDCQHDPQYGLYLVLEWLYGCTLEDVLKHGRLSGREVRVVFRQLCWALELAQSYGIVHRDIKPANIFLQKHFNSFQIKLMDFGVSTASGGGTGELTMAGQMLGSAPYMPPEQVRGDIASIDGRSDIYSCGILLAETLTGKPPFTGSMPSLLFKHLQDPPPPLRQLAPDIRVNDRIEAIYQKSLAKTNDQRFGTPLEFWFALREALVGSSLGKGTLEEGVVMRTLNEIFQKTDDAQAKRQLHASYFWGDNEISDEPEDHVSPSSADLVSVAAALQPREDRTGAELPVITTQDDLPTSAAPLDLAIQEATQQLLELEDHLKPPPPPPLPPHLAAQEQASSGSSSFNAGSAFNTGSSSGSSSFVPLPDPKASVPFIASQPVTRAAPSTPNTRPASSSFPPLPDTAQRSGAQNTFPTPQTPQQGNAPFAAKLSTSSYSTQPSPARSPAFTPIPPSAAHPTYSPQASAHQTGQHASMPSQRTGQHPSMPSQRTGQHPSMASQHTSQHNALPAQRTGQHNALPPSRTGQHNALQPPQGHHSMQGPSQSSVRTGQFQAPMQMPQAPVAVTRGPNPSIFGSPISSSGGSSENPYEESDALLADLMDATDYYEEDDEGDATVIAPQGMGLQTPFSPQVPVRQAAPRAKLPQTPQSNAQAVKPPPPPPPPPPSSALSRMGATQKKKP
ncbi:MAG: protein kinase [Myxococcales bacterium]|nr:protein kinase [Myxococcales bacterium]